MRHHPIPHRRKVLFAVLGAFALVIAGGVIAFVVLLSGAYSTAATKEHFAITYRLLDLGLRYSVQTNAADIEVPLLNDHARVVQGAACYRRYCVQCHGAPGVARGDLAKGMLPSPSSLSQSAREWPAAELYYVTRKGVRMTGMPPWEFRIHDDALWSTVAFLKAMPLLTAASYRELVETSDDQDCPRAQQTAPYSKEYAQTVLKQYACHNCHKIDDVVGPQTFVGPSLHDWRKRKLIAGALPNTPENLVRWIVDPQQVSPDTLMPDLGVSELHAREIATYLFGQVRRHE